MKTTNSNTKPTPQQMCDALALAADVQRALEAAQARGDAEGVATAQKIKAEVTALLSDLFARA